MMSRGGNERRCRQFTRDDISSAFLALINGRLEASDILVVVTTPPSPTLSLSLSERRRKRKLSAFSFVVSSFSDISRSFCRRRRRRSTRRDVVWDDASHALLKAKGSGAVSRRETKERRIDMMRSKEYGMRLHANWSAEAYV